MRIEDIQKQAPQEMQNAQSVTDLDTVYNTYLGKNGELQAILKTLKNMSPDEKAKLGKEANVLKKELEGLYEERKSHLYMQETKAQMKQEQIDPSEHYPSGRYASVHPATLIEKDFVTLAQSMGFSIIDGPELEGEWYNFDAVNIPKIHPARDHQDTFFINAVSQNLGRLVLRTQTSSVQVRGMQRFEPPMAFVVPGRCFRNENLDASHEAMMPQIEGVVIDTDISFANMKATMRTIMEELFGRKIQIKIEPTYYPFVEPGVQMSIDCSLCQGQGCSACKQTGYTTVVGAGMIHPNVLRAAGIDPDTYSGFAFGFGTQRLAMMKYGIEDIRWFNSPRVEFLKQFQK